MFDVLGLTSIKMSNANMLTVSTLTRETIKALQK